MAVWRYKVGTNMKKKLLLTQILILLVLLIGCKNKNDDAEKGNNSEKQANNSAVNYEKDKITSSFVSETPDGVFILGYDNIVRYKDKDTGQYVPWCNKPNCKHEKECNASLKCHSNLQYKNNKLYYTKQNEESNVISIYCADLDNSNEEKVVDLYTADIKRNFYNLYWYVDSEYVYVISSQRPEVKNHDRPNDYEVKVEMISIKTGERKKIFNKSGEIAMFSEHISINNDKIYFTYSEFDSDNIKYDYMIYSVEGENVTKITELNTSISAVNGNFMYNIEKPGNLFKIDLTTGEKTLFFELDDNYKYSVLVLDDKYIYINNTFRVHESGISKDEMGIKIYDYNGKAVDEIKFEDPATNLGGYDYGLLGFGDDFYYYNKSEIGSGDIKIRKIEE